MLAALNSVSVLDLSLPPIFGQMVNVGFGPAGILGLCLAGAGAGLYLLRSTRPELARDYDIFFSAIGLLCGGILFFNGWRLDPILMFGQVLMAGSAVFFAFESIRLRSITTDQARRGGGREPIIDDERDYPVDRVYRAELDEIEPFMEDRPPVRRIRGARETEAADRAAYRDNYENNQGYSGDSYDDESYPNAGYGSRSSRRSSSRRRSRSSGRSPAYGASAAYDAGGQTDYDSNYGSDSNYSADASYSADTSYGTDRVDYEANASRSSRRPARSDWDSPSESRRSPSSSRRSSRSSRDRYYDDEPAAPRSSRRSRTSSDPASRRSKPSTDDYVDYKPIGNYAESSSSSTYGSRRPTRDYDDEWGAS